MPNQNYELMFIELSDEDVLKGGKAFEGLTHGTFTDMLGYKAVIKKAALGKMVENTKELIESTVTESGEVVGLPVDAFGHDNGDGAGWVKDVNLSDDGNKIMFSVEWTEIGVNLISKKIRRWFSATVNLGKNLIFGGTLTNWPAVRAKSGEYLLAPIELSNARLFELSNEGWSTLQQLRAVERAFYEVFDWEYWIEDLDLEDNYIVVRTGGQYFKATFEMGEKDNVQIQEEDKWVKTRKTWKDLVGDFASRLFNNDAPNQSTQEEDMEELVMNEETRKEIMTMISEAISPISTSLAAIAAVTPEEPNGNGHSDDVRTQLASLVNLDGMTEELNHEIQNVLMGEVEAIQRMAKADFARKLARTKIEATTTELVTNLTQGTAQTPRGMSVDAEELKKQMLSLNPDQYEYFTKVLETVWRNGFVEFSELGHQQDIEGKAQLPEDIREQLESGELTIKDLRNPILAPVIGDLSQYDLSEFKVKE